MINDQNVFLVATACLKGPVERSSEHKLVVADHKLVMHVEARLAVSPHRNACLSKSLDIRAFIACTLIVADDSHMNSSLVALNYSISQIVVCDVEHADK